MVGSSVLEALVALVAGGAAAAASGAATEAALAVASVVTANKLIQMTKLMLGFIYVYRIVCLCAKG